MLNILLHLLRKEKKMLQIVNVEKEERTYPRSYRNYKDYQKSPRVYFWFEDETVIDHLFNRHSEPHREFRKVMPQVFEKVGMEAVKFNWSQYAGCRCSCSPGFILKTTGAFDIFVTVAGEE